MRLTTWLSLVALGLLSSTGCADTTSGHSRPARETAPPWKDRAVGYGTSLDNARLMAWEVARLRVTEFLRKCDPPVSWTPSVDYLRAQKLVVREEVVENANARPSSRFEVRLDVEVNDQQLRDMQRHDRRERMGLRQSLWIKIVIGLVAILALVAGYHRLEETTCGFYTNLLRLALAGAAGLVAAGVWLVL